MNVFMYEKSNISCFEKPNASYNGKLQPKYLYKIDYYHGSLLKYQDATNHRFLCGGGHFN